MMMPSSMTWCAGSGPPRISDTVPAVEGRVTSLRRSSRTSGTVASLTDSFWDHLRRDLSGRFWPVFMVYEVFEPLAG